MRINDESADGPALFTAEFAHFIRRVEEFLVGMNGEETRVGRLGGEFRGGRCAAGGIEPRDMNPFALGAGVGADVNEELF